MIFSIGAEALITSLAFLVAVLYPQLGRSWFRSAERILPAFADRCGTYVPFSCCRLAAPQCGTSKQEGFQGEP